VPIGVQAHQVGVLGLQRQIRALGELGRPLEPVDGQPPGVDQGHVHPPAGQLLGPQAWAPIALVRSLMCPGRRRRRTGPGPWGLAGHPHCLIDGDRGDPTIRPSRVSAGRGPLALNPEISARRPRPAPRARTTSRPAGAGLATAAAATSTPTTTISTTTASSRTALARPRRSTAAPAPIMVLPCVSGGGRGPAPDGASGPAASPHRRHDPEPPQQTTQRPQLTGPHDHWVPGAISWGAHHPEGDGGYLPDARPAREQ
jgi:hypothetical protein